MILFFLTLIIFVIGIEILFYLIGIGLILLILITGEIVDFAVSLIDKIKLFIKRVR